MGVFFNPIIVIDRYDMNYKSEEQTTEVLVWLDSLKIPESQCRYRFSNFSDDTIFCTCFALFILDLFKETDSFTCEERQSWISCIQSFQNKEHGYFEPATYFHIDKERNRYQLTCFCLSALKILDADPRFSLKFIESFETPNDIKTYLSREGCADGKPGSGNKAMFLGIFLTYQYEKSPRGDLMEKINAWFEFHDASQNSSGFWGSAKRSHFFHGLQNGFHQMLLYFYWDREIKKLNKIVDMALKIQSKDGFFSPTPGGEACHDYDAIHILINAYRISNYRHNEIAASLEKAFHAIQRNQNEDAGFCQSKFSLGTFTSLVKSIPFFLSGKSPRLCYERLRRCVGIVLRGESIIKTGWTEKGRLWNESNLWDTWFRCLSLAEIANTICLGNSLGLENTNFHKMLGLGYFNKEP